MKKFIQILLVVLVAGVLVGAFVHGWISHKKNQPHYVYGPEQIIRRWKHRATILQDGRVLITGGVEQGSAIAKCEIFDPTRNVFIKTGDMNYPRSNHTATLLPNGKVLIAGGSYYATGYRSAELYDPSSNSFSVTGEMTTTRSSHTANLLANGNVILFGGKDESVELFDYRYNTFTKAKDMKLYRRNHVSIQLNNGNILLAGSTMWTKEYLQVEEYNPLTQKSTLTDYIPNPLKDYKGISLTNERVLLGPYVYNPESHKFDKKIPLNYLRQYHAVNKLPSGRIIITGSDRSKDLNEVYNPTNDSLKYIKRAKKPRSHHTATVLHDGRVLIVGGLGRGGFAIKQSEFFIEGKY